MPNNKPPSSTKCSRGSRVHAVQDVVEPGAVGLKGAGVLMEEDMVDFSVLISWLRSPH
jgi:hypothetical protein